MQELRADVPSETELGQTLLEAHRDLNENNRQMFKSVVEGLEKEVKRLDDRS